MSLSRNKIISLVLVALVLGGGTLLVLSGEMKTAFDAIIVYVFNQQRWFSRSLSDSVVALRDTAGGVGGGATWTLVTLGFVYGIFHAIGPGHGKAVISAYALTHETRFRRTIGLSFGAAFVQALSAILVVGVLSTLVDGSVRHFATSADDVLNPISFAAVTILGIYLLVRGLSPLIKAPSAALAPLPKTSKELLHEHSHDHDETCGCGHSHAPTPQQVQEASSFWRAASIALAVGIRPCTGAILVLVLTFSFGFVLSGIMAVLAMALGTAITVSTLAVGAQCLRWPLAELLSAWGLRAGLLGSALMILGGLFIVVVGATLLFNSLIAPTHPFF